MYVFVKDKTQRMELLFLLHFPCFLQAAFFFWQKNKLGFAGKSRSIKSYCNRVYIPVFISGFTTLCPIYPNIHRKW